VQQKDQRPFAGLDVVQSLVADLSVAVTEFALLVHDDHSREPGSVSAATNCSGVEIVVSVEWRVGTCAPSAFG
jgi:hypothetical protein